MVAHHLNLSVRGLVKTLSISYHHLTIFTKYCNFCIMAKSISNFIFHYIKNSPLSLYIWFIKIFQFSSWSTGRTFLLTICKTNFYILSDRFSPTIISSFNWTPPSTHFIHFFNLENTKVSNASKCKYKESEQSKHGKAMHIRKCNALI